MSVKGRRVLAPGPDEHRFLVLTWVMNSDVTQCVPQDAGKLEETESLLRNAPETDNVVMVMADLSDASSLDDCIRDVFAQVRVLTGV